MKELVEHLARELVDDPDSVSVTEDRHGSNVTYEVRVAPEDTGKVIGRQGRMINAIRTLVKAAATKTRDRTNVEVVS